MNRADRERLAAYRRADKERRVIGFLWLALGAFLVGLILAAPVMREPTHTISATAYFGDSQ